MTQHYLLFVVLVGLLLFTCVNTQNCLTLAGPNSSVGSFKWTTQADQLNVTVAFPKNSLTTGWVAVGFSNVTSFGMAGADILFLYLNSTTSNIEVYEKKATSTSKPSIAVGNRFELDTVKTKVEGNNLVLSFAKKFTYSAADAVEIMNYDQALLVAMDTTTTPTSEDSFNKHNWAQKKVVNFMSTVNDCQVAASSSIVVTDSSSGASFVVGTMLPIIAALMALLAFSL